MIHNKFRYLLTLVVLFAISTGAWADGKVYTSAVDITALQVGDILTEGASINGKGSIIFDNNRVKVNGTLQTDGFCYLYTSDFDSFGAEGVISLSNNTTMSPVDKDNNDGNAWEVTNVENNNYIHIQGITYAPAGIEVTWNTETKTASFTMPAYDVEIAPIYAPVAKWATEGDAVLTPTAIEGIFAESTDAIVTAGTVAKIGDTENVQGIVMYAVTSTNQATAPALDAFSADVPTAKDITAAGDVLVWYYIAGADTPQGQDPTAENTFNDSEISKTPIKVTLLSNKFDIAFKAANANTIEAGKATVTVGGAAATVTEGKLEGVKMGSEVKMTAKDGYKFRKVEVKKGAGKTITIGDVELTYADGDTWETIVSKNSDKIKTRAGGYIVQVAQPAPNKYKYLNVWYTKVNPSDIIDPSKKYQWGDLEVNY